MVLPQEEPQSHKNAGKRKVSPKQLTHVSKKEKNATLYMYVCKCTTLFQRKNNLQDHIQVCHQKETFPCETCGNEYGVEML